MTSIRSSFKCSVILLGLGLFSTQYANAQDQTTTRGTVISSSAHTVTVREDSGQYELFTFDRNTRKPATLAAGSLVRIISTPGGDAGVRSADEITVIPPGGATAASSAQTDTVSPAMRGVERDIERAARRYRIGFRAGAALDPELIMIGVQGQVGPFFTSNVYFRPSVEFGWGEVTSMFALNPDILFRLPGFARQTSRWKAYVGGGPGFNFLHQGFHNDDGSGKRIDFGDFHSSTGLNILGGVEARSGMFVELRTAVYSQPAPTLRLIFGYNF